MSKRLIGYVKVSRPPLLLMGLIGPLACLKWIGDKNPIESLLLIIAIFCGNWAWNLYNEYHDIEVDWINKPWKPLPSGIINKNHVIHAFWILFYSSFAANVILINWNIFYAIGFLAHFTSFIYNHWRRDLIGNICEVVTIGLAPFIIMYPKNLFFPFSLATLFFGIALITQHQDLEAERTKDIVTAPQQLGRKGTALVSFFSLLIAFITLAWYNRSFIFFFASGISNMLCSVAIFFNRSENSIIELFSRKLGRIFILLGFILMLV